MSDPIKYLSFAPVSEDTSLAKQKSVAGEIRLLRNYLIIPIYQIFTDDLERRLCFQHNVSLGYDFYISNFDALRGLGEAFLVQNGCLCIKYRVGTTVTRYNLLDSTVSDDWSHFDRYNGELIKGNFCIEFWYHGGILTDHGIVSEISLQLSPLTVPVTPYDSDFVSNVSNPPLLIADLGVNLPETLPYNQTNQAFLTN